MQIKKDVKAKLTLSAAGASAGEGPRTHVQGAMSHFSTNGERTRMIYGCKCRC